MQQENRYESPEIMKDYVSEELTRQQVYALAAAAKILNPDPANLTQALSSPDAEKWRKAVKDKYESLVKNKT